ncbi:adhesin [Jiangella mangrovi]|uniref:Fe-S cluster assembly iron-binding protein IscA n=1 Tax=Jiangella mangrovi TaxID=1524084 RepID=A0A7W9GSG1_9ACTN|nr:adhesin [Jiangella mangrovi]MBB5789215.1 Fe-S cluster assembly iron-binding protein IscA [Jiangella mangrovi]
MLMLTDNAAAVIRNIEGREDLPMGTGMRIAANPEGGLDLELRPSPEEGDQVLDDAGARLFLDADAAIMLDDKALDASVDPAGSIRFAVTDQIDGRPGSGDMPGMPG